MKKLSILTILILLVLLLTSCSQAPANNVVTVPALTYAEYMAASENAKVEIEGFVQSFVYYPDFNSVNMFIQDDDGAYYAYRAVCDAEKAKSLKEGIKVRVSGVKGSYAGEVEVQEQCTFEILEGSKIYGHTDVTALMGDEKAMEKLMNQKVSLKGLVVSESYGKEDDSAAAFLYSWDGSGGNGGNFDIYFIAGTEDSSSLFVVESDEFPEGTELYDAAEKLAVGDVIDLEGFMYWYNGPNIHISALKTTKASRAETKKGEGTLRHKEYLEAGDEEEVTIEAYVQNLSHFDEETGTFSAFLADAAGAYYAKDIEAEKSVYDRLSEGMQVKLSGVRATENGMPLISKSSIELMDGYYIAPAENVTSIMDDDDALAEMAGQKVTVRGTTLGAVVFEEDKILTATAKGLVYTFRFDTADHPEGSPLYNTADSIAPGSTVDLVCFVYLDPEPQLTVSNITIK